MSNDVLNKQVGGDHYKKLPIQPMFAAIVNNLPWAEAEIIKYVTRWRDKGGVQDLKKAHHILGFLIDVKEGRLDRADLMQKIEKALEAY